MHPSLPSHFRKQQQIKEGGILSEGHNDRGMGHGFKQFSLSIPSVLLSSRTEALGARGNHTKALLKLGAWERAPPTRPTPLPAERGEFHPEPSERAAALCWELQRPSHDFPQRLTHCGGALFCNMAKYHSTQFNWWLIWIRQHGPCLPGSVSLGRLGAFTAVFTEHHSATRPKASLAQMYNREYLQDSN